MEEIKQKITQVLDKFAQQELGNRLSEFAMISLKILILQEFNKPKEEEKE